MKAYLRNSKTKQNSLTMIIKQNVRSHTRILYTTVFVFHVEDALTLVRVNMPHKIDYTKYLFASFICMPNSA